MSAGPPTSCRRLRSAYAFLDLSDKLILIHHRERLLSALPFVSTMILAARTAKRQGSATPIQRPDSSLVLRRNSRR